MNESQRAHERACLCRVTSDHEMVLLLISLIMLLLST
jgi:hypothetical protein